MFRVDSVSSNREVKVNKDMHSAIRVHSYDISVSILMLDLMYSNISKELVKIMDFNASVKSTNSIN